MKNSAALVLLMLVFYAAAAQSHAGLEQYYYFGRSQDVSLVSIGYYQNAHNWYGEVRYNYEEKKTVSLYAGKTFSNDGKFAYTATPMLGLLLGQFNGGSAGGNFSLEYKGLSISTQLQYIFSGSDKSKNFILTWSELGYQIKPFVKAGLALQQTTVYNAELRMEAGCFLSFSYKNWELPLYVFSPSNKSRNYVIGVNWEWQHAGKSNKPLTHSLI